MVKIMNKNLFDPKDVKIARLEAEIKAFKKYDKKRTEYYKSVIEENKQLRELLAVEPMSKEKAKITKLEKGLHNAHIALERKNINLNGVTDEQLAQWSQNVKFARACRENPKLKVEVRNLKATVHSLVNEKCALERKLQSLSEAKPITETK